MKEIDKYKKLFTDEYKLSFIKFAKYAGIAAGSILFILILILVLFQNSILNGFIKSRVTKSFNDANSGYVISFGELNYNLWENRLACDSIKINSSDTTFTFTVSSLAVSRIGWLKVILQNDFAVKDLADAIITSQKIVLNLHESQDELIIKSLKISVPDSSFAADSISYKPLLDDEAFFEKSNYRQTRINLNVPRTEIRGLDLLSLIQGSAYKFGGVNIFDLTADILVNMDKPYDRNSPKPLMPNEALFSLKEKIKIDSLKIFSGRIKYGERYGVRAIPGVISFSKLNVSISGVENHSSNPKPASIYCEGLFMNSSTVKMIMTLPLTSSDFSLKYYGSLSRMDAQRLNAFVKPAEFHLINSGIIESAKYDITVNSGHAAGTVHVAYKDFAISILNKKTGSKEGLGDRFASMIGKIFIIRGTNMPDRNGRIEIGEVDYSRRHDDNFLQFIWFALRSGLADVVGF